MESSFLETFVIVVRRGSLAAAAHYQGISPATVALRIKSLESEFGTALVKRSGRKTAPTEAGARIFDQTQALLRELDDLKGLATNQEMVGQLRLGVIASLACGILPLMMRMFYAQHPKCRIYVEQGVSSVLFQAVCDGQLDAAMIVEPLFGVPKTCRWLRLNQEELILLASSGQEITDVHRALATVPLIRYARHHWGGRIADDYLRLVGIDPIELCELDALDSIAALVEQGLGVSLVPNWAGPWHLNRPIAKHPLPIAGFQRNIGVLWSKGSVRLRHVEYMVNAAKEVIAGFGGNGSQ
jgi:DNA-binding transcriptional LysR family regulator